jgi:hypothetical protein
LIKNRWHSPKRPGQGRFSKSKNISGHVG